MTVQFDLTYLIGLVIMLAGAWWGMAKLLLGQAQAHIDEKFKGITDTLRQQDETWRRVERELMDLKAELPRDYVRREDHNRVVGSIQLAIDNLSLKIDRALLQSLRASAGGSGQ